jgi:hypothetical protein
MRAQQTQKNMQRMWRNWVLYPCYNQELGFASMESKRDFAKSAEEVGISDLISNPPLGYVSMESKSKIAKIAVEAGIAFLFSHQ